MVCDSAEVSNLPRQRTLALLKRLYAFFSTSPKCHSVHEKYVRKLCRSTGGRELLQLTSATGRTGRSAGSDNLEANRNCLPAIVASLMEIEQRDIDASPFLRSIRQFDFVLAICVLRDLLLLCRSVSEYLQAADVDMLALLTTISDLTNKLQAIRNDSIPALRKLYEAACATCCTPSIGVALPTASDRQHKRRKQAPHHCASSRCSTV